MQDEYPTWVYWTVGISIMALGYAIGKGIELLVRYARR